MNELPESPAGAFSRLYDTLTGYRAAVAEPAVLQRADAALQEKVVRCLWFDQFLDAGNLRIEDGRKLSVFSPGYWSEGAGPDFRNAEFALGDGPRLRGDVELHVKASEWNQHGHAADPAYAHVLLHVVLHNDLGEPTVAHGGRLIPQAALEHSLSADLGEILSSLDPEGYPRVGSGREGPCCRSIRAAGRDETWVGRFLDIAGDERMLRKAERFAALIEKRTPDDALYEALMEVMGYTVNRRPFRLLAADVPLARLRRFVPLDADPEERRLAVQALLFGAAGFLADSADTSDLARSLRDRWEAVRKEFPHHSIDRHSWNYRTRPTNYPLRRIAGISTFLATSLHSGLCRAMLGAVESIPADGRESRRCRETLRRFHALLDEPVQAYWARRTGFGPETLARPTALIGEARTTEMIVNVVIPLLLALSRRGDQPRAEQRLHNVYASLRPLSDNAVTKYMKSRLFVDAESGDRVISSMRRQQGLLQLFHDYCESNTATCEACGFLAAIERW